MGGSGRGRRLVSFCIAGFAAAGCGSATEPPAALFGGRVDVTTTAGSEACALSASPDPEGQGPRRHFAMLDGGGAEVSIVGPNGADPATFGRIGDFAEPMPGSGSSYMSLIANLSPGEYHAKCVIRDQVVMSTASFTIR